MSLDIQSFIDFLSNENTHIPVEANFKIRISNLFFADAGTIPVLAKLNNVQKQIAPNNGVLKVLVGNQNVWPQGAYKQDTVLFANGVSVPGESVGVARAGMSAESGGLHGGLLSAPILKGRKDLSNLEITFIETNVSFIDTIIRPWSVATAQYGLFARSQNSLQNFKTTVTIDYLDKTGKANEDSETRKRITFSDAAPVEVASYETTYGSTGKSTDIRSTKTSWVYSTYSIDYPKFN